MSEQGEKPEVLPGDLIMRPGLYESRSQGVVEVRHWGRDGWVAQWGDKERIYFSDGTRTGLYPMPDPYQLLHWVGPLAESEPEPETTAEQLAEIEEQAEDTPATEYTQPEGWRVLQVGEELRQGDVRVDDSGACSAVLVTVTGVVPHGRRYIRPIEPEPQPQPQSEPVQVREGRWRTRGGDIRNVTPTPTHDSRRERWPWRDAAYDQTWTPDGQNQFNCEESPSDLVEYLGPIEPDKTQELPEYTPPEGWRVLAVGEVLQLGDVWVNHEGESRPTKRVGERVNDERYIRPIEPQPQAEPEPQPEPIQVREGRWKTRAREIVSVSAMPTDHDDFSDAYPWWDGDVTTWANNGVFFNGYTVGKDLVEYLGPIEQPEPEPESDAELRIRLLNKANDLQAETIGRLQGEARDLNMEIGGLERQLLQRDARIRDLETMHAAASQAVVDAGKQNDALRAQVQNRQQEYERQKGRIEFLETLDAGNAVAIVDYRAKVEKLQGLVGFANQQLEAVASERDELRAAVDQADKQLDQKDAQIRDLRIELEAAQQVQQPVGDEERERIWDEATEQAGRQVVRWLRPLTLALTRQPDEQFRSFMTLTLSVLPDLLPELLEYAVEDEAEGEE